MPKLSATSGKDRAVRLAELADRARALGRAGQADRFLLLAWAAYDDIEFVPDASTIQEQPSRRAS